MKLIHLEDDPLYAEYVHLELQDLAKEDKVSLAIRHIRTERQFTEELNTIIESGDAFLLDVMVRWCFPEDDPEGIPMKKPLGDYYDAGLRCARLLLDQLPQLPSRTILLYTVYQREEIKAELDALEAIRGKHQLKILTKGEDMEEVWNTIQIR